jgi:hypothetical protein
MDLIICQQCGDAVASYYITQGLCDGCKWDTWIPGGYEKKERYLFDPAAGHFNRTCRPALGVQFLDVGLHQVDLSVFTCIGETERKRFAAHLLAEGFTQAETAQQVGVRQGTVCKWATRITKKLHARNIPRHFRVKH